MVSTQETAIMTSSEPKDGSGGFKLFDDAVQRAPLDLPEQRLGLGVDRGRAGQEQGAEGNSSPDGSPTRVTFV